MPRVNPSSSWLFLRRNWHIGFIALSVLVFIASLGALFYVRGQSIMEQRLREKLRVTAAIGALQFQAEELNLIHSREALASPLYREIVGRLEAIRQAAPGVDFAYIMRRTNNPDVLEFVADADSLASLEQLDINGNGLVDADEEASYPGDPYQIVDTPALKDAAFREPTVDEEITMDQWGAFISGYAPIRDHNGTVVAVLGLDMHAEEFFKLSQSIFSPVAFLLVLAAAAMISLYIFWAVVSRRIQSMHQMEDERSSLLQLALHRLGTPLTIFKWSVEILEDCNTGVSCPRNSVDDHLAQMTEGIVRMEQIIHALLKADRIEMSPLRVTPEILQIRSVLDEAVESVRPRLEHKHQNITVDPDGLIEVYADRAVLSGVVHELLENASLYSPDGSDIILRARKQRGWTKIEVIDQGCGIPLADIGRIFGRFVRGRNVPLVHPDGNGLGLYVARHLVEGAGGKIWLESAGEGKGTRACVLLPLSGERRS